MTTKRKKPDWRDNDLYRTAARCAEVVKAYGGPDLDPNLEGLRLIASFAYALDVPMEVRFVPKTGKSQGGYARAASLSAKQRSEIASKAAKKRWHAEGQPE